MLLNLSEILTALESKFSPFKGEMDDLILMRGGCDINEINELEHELNVILPDDFKDFLINYNVDNFSLGSIAFGNGSSYIHKLGELNSRNELSQWWGKGERPSNLLVIAYNDPYTICLNVNNGEVYAVTPESGLNNLKPIAKNFTLFFRGVANIFLGHSAISIVEVEVESKCNEFWVNVL